jgi:hypothetical protein
MVKGSLPNDSRLAAGCGPGHGGGMWRSISAVGTWLTRIESWLALAFMVMSTSAFAWLAHQWAVLATQGWAAVDYCCDALRVCSDDRG